MAKALLVTFLAAQAVGFLPLYTVVCFAGDVPHGWPWWFEWGLWVLAVACAVFLGPEAARSWKRLEGHPLKTSAVFLTGWFGFNWGFTLSFFLSVIWD